MTRKDYELIAATIRDTQERINEQAVNGDLAKTRNQLRGVRRTAAHLAEALCDTDDEKIAFIKACGYGA